MKKKTNSQKSTSTVLFSLPKAIVGDASSVIVVGDFSEWNPVALKAQKDGSFAVEVEVPLGREYHFRYQIDGNRWENDIAADRYETSPIYGHIDNSVLDLVNVQSEPVAAKTKEKTTVKKEVAKAASEVVAKVATVKKATSKAIVKKADETVKAASKVISKTATSVLDDLTKIEGIGPKIAELLKADGIESFEKLAKSGFDTVKGILENAGKRYKMHNPTTWIEQAKLAAKGDWTSLKKWQDELSGGKSK